MAHLAEAVPLNRALETLAGSDALFSRVGGLNGDPAAVALAALPPLEMATLPDIGDAGSALPLGGVALAQAPDALDATSLLGSTSLAGGLPVGGLPAGGLPIGGGVASIIDTLSSALTHGETAPGVTTLGSVGDLLNGADPAAAVTNAVETAVVSVGHVGSGAAAAVEAVGGVLDNPPIETLNGVVDGLHSGIELASHTLGLNATLHGVTNLGTTLGLGDIGGENLLTDVVDLPGAVLGGDLSGSIEAVTAHLGDVLEAAPNVVTSLVTDLETALGGDGNGGTIIENVAGVLNGGDPIGGVTNVVGSVGATVAPILGGVADAVGDLGNLGGSPIDTLNTVVDDLHAGIEQGAHVSGLNFTLHGVTNLGETIGLGDIGGDNLLTDVVGLTDGGDPTAAVGGIVEHVGAVVPAAVGVAEGAVADVEAALGGLTSSAPGGTLLGTVAGVLSGDDPLAGAATAVAQAGETVGHLGEGALGAVGALDGLGAASPTDVLNEAVGELHAGIEQAAHVSGLNYTLHGVTNLGETIGLGEIGGDNLLTDVTDLTGVLSGGDPTAALGGVVDHAGAILPAAGEIVEGVVTDLGAATGGSLPLPTGGADSLVGTLEDAIHIPGGGLPEPVASVAGGGLDLDGLGGLGALGDLTDLGGALHIGTPEHHGGGLGLV